MMAEMMESDLGKLFIGGISWDTDEDRLKEYFGSYGEVVEAVIMRDRNTGRARGFGFVVFADPAVAERVVKEKHMIDGRTVEAKKAVPRDDQQIINRNNSSIQGSPGPGRTKKIFVGGLASTVTESDFKAYFDQFGTITDVVVMYDHNTQRPRGFGFITYDSEDAVDRTLYKTFHELNGKMVEVKRAVPKELSPAPNRSPLMGYNYGLNRANNFLNNYAAQGYNLASVGGYGVRMDGRFSPVGGGRAGFSQFASPAYGMGVNLDPALSPTFAGASNFSNNLGYGRILNPYFGANSSRYTTPIGYSTSSNRGDSFLSSPTRNLWGNIGLNASASSGGPGSFVGSGSGNYGVFGNNIANWGSLISAPAGNSSGYGGANFRSGENNYGLGSGGLGRNNAAGAPTTSSFTASTGAYEGSYGDQFRGASVYGDRTWQGVSSDADASGSFEYGLGNPADVSAKDSEDYIGNYSLANRQSNRGISRDSMHKRRATGGKKKAWRKKRKYEMGRQSANTKLVHNAKTVRRIRVRGGNVKWRALRLDTGNYSWGSEAVTRKTRLLDVVYNASNNELVRTQTLVKSAIVQVDAAPFKQWYLQHYGVEVGRKKKSAAKKEGEEAPEAAAEEKKSNHVQRKLEKRQQDRKIDPHVEEQFASGRLLAAISSRPGQCGRADGYILEGKELEFYMKKLQKKKGKGASGATA
ncbi:40S ribosomal protein S8 [Capsicum annuum]|uniref:40S ribosomal protein S8 n=1 Tax=Capsicum annuum TaxID=4072 RepID=A0A2G2YIY9_CAPAN|nr:40S ribosomal protein S8 [Capsicum annuum]